MAARLLQVPQLDASRYRRYSAASPSTWSRSERDLWILMQSVSPEQATIWIAEKLVAMRDPLDKG